MAAADTARLVAQLTLDSKGFNQGVKSANASIGKLEGTVGNIGKKAGAGLQTAGRNIALLGVAAAGGIALAVKGGLNSLAELETAVTSVDGAVKQLGLTGQVTGDQVAKWANEIERDVDAAFDDKAITAAAATLLRFGKVTPDNLKQSLVVMTDLAAKTGDVESASTLLAKALADPAKAAGKLAKSGVVLTKAQQDTIKAMVEANDVAGAQKFILDELARTTGGAAAASQGKYNDALNLLADASEDAKKALATGFLPVIEKVADKLSVAVADPAFLKGLEAFGTELAGGLDDLISVAEKLPWATIGDSLKLAGTGAKAVLTAFTSLPPWVQTAVITGWGLNKLTGGALGGIVGELGKGLVKGVLGINAGVVNIKAATVVGGGGGIPGAGGKGGGGIVSKVGTVVTAVLAPAAGLAIGFEVAKALGANVNSDPLLAIKGLLQTYAPALPLINDNNAKINTSIGEANRKLAALGQTESNNLRSNERQESIANANATKVASQIAAGDTRTELAISGAKAASTAGLNKTAAAAQAAAAAIRAKKLSTEVNVTVPISQKFNISQSIHTQQTFRKFYKTAQ